MNFFIVGTDHALQYKHDRFSERFPAIETFTFSLTKIIEYHRINLVAEEFSLQVCQMNEVKFSTLQDLARRLNSVCGKSARF